MEAHRRASIPCPESTLGRRWLVRGGAGVSGSLRRAGWARWDLQDDVVGAEVKDLSQSSKLRDLRQPAPALPQVDGLRLDPNLQRKLELSPATGLAQCADRWHLSPFSQSIATQYNRYTS